MALQAGARLIGDDGLLQLRRVVEMRARRAVQEVEKEFRDYVSDSMRAPKHGYYYRRPGRIHQASAPGEAPAVDYGRLLGSLRTEFGSRGLTAKVIIGNNSTIAYASELEEGHITRYGVVRPRPYWKPAVDYASNIFLTNLRTKLNTIKV